MNKENKIYTAADFANYHKGNMPFVEMHALEKAALDDPFLADALDGYATLKTTEIDNAQLKKRLSNYTAKPNVFSTSSFLPKSWLRIAALLIVMLGIGYFFYNKYDDKEIAIAQNKTPVIDTLQIAETKTDAPLPKTATIVKTENAVIPLADKENKSLKKVDKKLLDTNVKDDYKQLANDNVTLVIAQEKAKDKTDDKKFLNATNAQQNNTQRYLKLYTQQGNVTDMRGGPLEGVTIRDKNTNYATITDNNGKFKLKTTDSNAYVSIGSVGFEGKEVFLKNNTLQKIALNRSNDNLQEVVVTSAYATQRKKSEVKAATTSISSRDLNGKVPGLNVQPQKETESIKIRGNSSITFRADTVLNNTVLFNEYVKNNIIPVFDENNKPIKGEVQLSFDIDKNGKPQNINIINTTCQPCNNQAINLLKNGPVWLNKVLQQQKIVIEF